MERYEWIIHGSIGRLYEKKKMLREKKRKQREAKTVEGLSEKKDTRG